ncbi:Protein translocase complex SecE/Sec61-gamma subunit [Arabidopsis suecica]|uniref:Protein translocase complex SecE/Sec61-gamma subunit n=1 Tax=Arabidopsis suecica TaxID=45249 RepID=A0A8T1YEJ0_ARASU|nr:Protein translocase complex SecE/Sec61-gamma subunit [Arabidopsis suecica]
MVVSPGLLSNVSGLIRLAPSHRIQRRDGFGPSCFKFSGDPSINGRVSHKHVRGYGTVVSVGQSWNKLPEEEPLWLSLLRDIVGSTRSLLSFMAEQPSQLKYIEWPSFTSTLKTATLSLCLVAVFIVGLSSVDAALCYILALILRKAP